MTLPSNDAFRLDIQPAYTVGRGGRLTRDGWDLFVCGNWHERYRLKREAQEEARKIAASFGGVK